MGRNRDSFGADFDIKTTANTRGIDDAEKSLSGLDKAVKDSGDSAEKAGGQAEKGESAFSKFASTALGAFSGLIAFDIAGQVTGVITDVAGEVIAWDAAMRDFQAQTGATDAELEEFRQTAQAVFTSGFGEDAQAVATAMAEVQQVTGAAGDELQLLTENALALEQAFGSDVKESIDAVDKAMTQFGIDGQTAFDLITYTMQETGDPAGDLLETVAEFGTNFEDLGYSAEQMFQVLNQGSDAGIFQFAKIGDAVKEFGIRVKEGGDEVEAAFDDMFEAGEEWTFASNFDSEVQIAIDSSDELFAAIRDGSVDISDVADEVSEYLLSIEDPLERNRLGVALLGSYYEDLGDDVLVAMDITEQGLTGTRGATDDLKDSLQNGLGPALNRLKRIAIVLVANAITPLALAVVNFLLPYLEEFGTWLETDGTRYLAAFGEILRAVAQFLIDMGREALNSIGGLEPILNTLADVGEVLQDVFGVVAESLSNLAVENADEIKEVLGFFAQSGIKAAIIGLGAAFGLMAISVVLALLPLIALVGVLVAYERDFGGLKTAFGEFGDAVKDRNIPKAAGALAKALIAIPLGLAKEMGKLLGIDVEGGLKQWQENWRMLGLIWEGLKKRVGAAVGGVVDTIKQGFNDLGDSLEGVVNDLSDGVSDIWQNITAFFEGAWEAINTTLTGAAAGISTSIADLITMIVTAFMSAKAAVVEAVRGVFNDALSVGASILSDPAGAFISAVNGLGGLIGGALESLGLLDTFNTYVTTPIETAAGAVSSLLSDPAGTLLAAVNGLDDLVSDGLAGLDSVLGTDLEGIWETALYNVASYIDDPAGTFLAAVGNIDTLITDNLAGLDETLGTNFEGIWETATQTVSDLLGDGSALIANIATFPNLVTNNLAGLTDKIQTSLKDPFSLADGFVTGLFGTAGQMLTHIGLLPENVVSGLAELANNLITALEQPFIDATTYVFDLFGIDASLLTQIGSLPANLITKLANLATDLTTALETPFQTSLTAVTGFIDDLLADLAAMPGNIATELSGLPAELTSSLIEPFKDAARQLGEIEILPGVSPNDIIGFVSGLAEGGTSQYGGIYDVGEMGKERVAIPPGGHVFTNSELYSMSHPRLDVAQYGGGGMGGGGETIIYIDNLILQGIQDVPGMYDALEKEKKRRAR